MNAKRLTFNCILRGSRSDGVYKRWQIGEQVCVLASLGAFMHMPMLNGYALV
jgi:hypothetical protein